MIANNIDTVAEGRLILGPYNMPNNARALKTALFLRPYASRRSKIVTPKSSHSLHAKAFKYVYLISLARNFFRPGWHAIFYFWLFLSYQFLTWIFSFSYLDSCTRCYCPCLHVYPRKQSRDRLWNLANTWLTCWLRLLSTRVAFQQADGKSICASRTGACADEWSRDDEVKGEVELKPREVIRLRWLPCWTV